MFSCVFKFFIFKFLIWLLASISFLNSFPIWSCMTILEFLYNIWMFLLKTIPTLRKLEMWLSKALAAGYCIFYSAYVEFLREDNHLYDVIMWIIPHNHVKRIKWWTWWSLKPLVWSAKVYSVWEFFSHQQSQYMRFRFWYCICECK